MIRIVYIFFNFDIKGMVYKGINRKVFLGERFVDFVIKFNSKIFWYIRYNKYLYYV